MSDKKKFVIRPFRPNISMDEAKAKGILDSLRTAIDAIHSMNASQLSFEELYRSAYNLVLHKYGDMLYTGVQKAIADRLVETAKEVSTTPDDYLLTVLNAKWSDHKVVMVMIKDIMMYMDRTYVAQNRKVPVYDLGLQLFREKIVRHEQVQDRLQNLLLDIVERERRGELIDRVLMKNTLSMLVDLGVHSTQLYEELFEQHLLRITEQFYRAESQQYLDKNSCSDYLRKTEERLQEEANRVTHYLHPSTEPHLKKTVETELIQKHAKSLVEMDGSGAVTLFRDDKIDDLKRMYSLFCRVPSTLQDLKASMQDYIKRLGEELVRRQEEVKETVSFVQGLLNLRDKFERIVSDAFSGDKQFHRGLKEAFESFINLDSRCASYLASYVDELLRNGLKGKSEEECDQLLDKVVVLFRYLQDKDIFESYYKQHLSKRLLSDRSGSDEMERNMIAKLKTECGYQFTSKLEGMFSDMKVSKDSMDEFRRINGKSVGGIEFSVNVLTCGSWPIPMVPKCVLPPQLVQCCETFQRYYFAKHTGRKLTWHTNVGTADLRAVFDRKYEMTVTSYQMCILLLFNDKPKLSYKEIASETQIVEEDLRRHLLSLCTPKARILLKESKGKSIETDDVFTINEGFKNRVQRFKVPLISHKERLPNVVPEPVEEDRKHQIEAAIVRIMKTRKTVEHNNLIAEVTKQLQSRFVPSPQIIKKRIESLIEREYIERTETDRRIYNYLA